MKKYIILLRGLTPKGKNKVLMAPLGAVLVPIFFVLIGLQVKLESFLDLDAVIFAAALTVAAVVGKQEIMDAVHAWGLGGTYGGNPVACAAGLAVLDVFEEEIERLTEIQGIAQKKLEMIRDAWTEHRAIREVMMFLQSHGISTLFAVRIYKEYGDKAI